MAPAQQHCNEYCKIVMPRRLHVSGGCSQNALAESYYEVSVAIALFSIYATGIKLLYCTLFSYLLEVVTVFEKPTE
jgi:hypothetical protein